jgi:hypothetical protein
MVKPSSLVQSLLAQAIDLRRSLALGRCSPCCIRLSPGSFAEAEALPIISPVFIVSMSTTFPSSLAAMGAQMQLPFLPLTG